MNRRLFCILILALCISPYVRVNLPETKAANGYPVHNVNTGLNYESIEAAINAQETLDGQTITVDAGTYDENLIINKALTIEGASSNSTIINSHSASPAVTIEANDVTLTKFTLGNVNQFGFMLNPLGVVFSESNDSTVTYCSCSILLNSSYGDKVDHCSGGTVYLYCSNNNLVSYCSDGIQLINSSYNLIYGNNIQSGAIEVTYQTDSYGYSKDTGCGQNTIANNILTGGGISLGGPYGQVFSDNNTVVNNTLVGGGISILGFNDTIMKNRVSRTDVGISVNLQFPFVEGNNVISENEIVNTTSGLLIRSSNNTVENNLVESNELGVRIDYSNVVLNNTISNNVYGLYLTSENNLLRDNQILGNNWSLVTGETGDNDIDTSNTINGAPIYYMVNQNGIEIDPSAFPKIGYLGLVNCSNVNIRSLKLTTRNGEGIKLIQCTNCSIEQTTIQNDCVALLIQSNSTTVKQNTIELNYQGIRLGGYFNKVEDNTIFNNSIRLAPYRLPNNWTGYFTPFEDWIYQDYLVQYSGGLLMQNSSNSTIIGNNVTDNENGILMSMSSFNTFRNNGMVDNSENFGVDPYSMLYPPAWALLPSHPDEISPYLINDVDKSNTINGKPVYWGISRHDEKVPTDAGYVVLVNSTRMIVQDLQIRNNAQDMLLVCVNDTIISNNTLTNSGCGVMIEPSDIQGSFNDSLSYNNVTANGGGFLVRSTNCTLSYNLIDKNIVGIFTYGGSYNLIIGNTITNSALPKTEDWILGYSPPYYGGLLLQYSNPVGIFLFISPNNTVCYNLVQNNTVGIETLYLTAGNNRIFHNNFINNTQQTSLYSVNVWDDGYPSGGNYWSNYNGTDIFNGPYQNQTGSDAIGDINFQAISETLQMRGLPPDMIQRLMNQYDSYPLMAPISHFDIGTWNGTSCAIDVVSSAVVTNFRFDPNATRPLISFNVTGDTAAEQFSRVTIPNAVVQGLWNGNYTVLIDGVFWSFTSYNDNASTYVYVNYTSYKHQIMILPIVSAQYVTVGVKKGDSIKYAVAYPNTEPSAGSTVWTKIEILNVTGTNVTVLIVYHSKEGSETNETRTIKVGNSTYPYVIPSDSQVGDTVYVDSAAVVITGEGKGVYAGVSRTVLTATARVAGDEWIYYCWDKQTGIMLGENRTGQYAMTAVETNMWSSNGGFLGLDWWVWAIILGETAMFVGALSFDRRRERTRKVKLKAETPSLQPKYDCETRNQ